MAAASPVLRRRLPPISSALLGQTGIVGPGTRPPAPTSPLMALGLALRPVPAPAPLTRPILAPGPAPVFSGSRLARAIVPIAAAATSMSPTPPAAPGLAKKRRKAVPPATVPSSVATARPTFQPTRMLGY